LEVINRGRANDDSNKYDDSNDSDEDGSNGDGSNEDDGSSNGDSRNEDDGSSNEDGSNEDDGSSNEDDKSNSDYSNQNALDDEGISINQQQIGAVADSSCAATLYSNQAIDLDVSNDEDEDNSDNSSPQQNNLSVSRKKGPLVNENFPLPPLGELEHPYRGWQIDKAAMEEYMQSWPKQEGFAVSKDTRNGVIYWRCVHQGKYRNRRDLPAEVTEKSRRQELRDAGTNKLESGLMNRRINSAAKRFIYKARMSILCGIYSDGF